MAEHDLRENLYDDLRELVDRAQHGYYMRDYDPEVRAYVDTVMELIGARNEYLTLGAIYDRLRTAIGNVETSDTQAERVTNVTYDVVLLMLDQAYEDGRRAAAG
jgi:hypothetical protein